VSQAKGVAHFRRPSAAAGRCTIPSPITDRQADVVPLRPRGADLGPLHVAALLQRPVIRLDGPASLGQPEQLQLAHRHVAGRPVFNVPVSGDDLEDLDRPVALQPDHRAARRDRRLADRDEPAAVGVDPAVGLQLRQPPPAEGADQLQVVQAAVPAVEGDALRREAPGARRGEHGAEVVVLRQPIRLLVVDPIVAGGLAVAVGPEQGDEVDAPDDPLMLARPVAGDEGDLVGVGLVQGRVIDDQDAARLPHGGLDLGPEGRGVGLEPVQQPGEGVVRRRPRSVGLHGGGLGAGGGARAGDQEVDVVGITALRGSHADILDAPARSRTRNRRTLIA
jgi:hypothetical protein